MSEGHDYKNNHLSRFTNDFYIRNRTDDRLNASTDEILSKSILITRNPNEDFRLVPKIPANVSIDNSVDNVLSRQELEKIRLQNKLQGEIWGCYDTIEKRDFRTGLARKARERNEYICENYLTKSFQEINPRSTEYYNRIR
jgi:hypothetical protein